jgi:hypothetical protein
LGVLVGNPSVNGLILFLFHFFRNKKNQGGFGRHFFMPLPVQSAHDLQRVDSYRAVFPRLLARLVDFVGPLDPTLVLRVSASSAACWVSALSVSAASRVLCAALRWLARRFISFALWAPRI